MLLILNLMYFSMNLEEMFQFPYEVFFVIWYDSVYHIHAYTCLLIIILSFFVRATVLHRSDVHGS